MTTIVKRKKMPYYPAFGSFRMSKESVNRNSFAPMNIIENNDVYIIELELAGWKKDDIELRLEKETLIISGEMDPTRSEDTKYHMQEFKNQRFFRSVILNEAIDKEAIDAKMKNGILTIELTKISDNELAGRKKIEIK